MHTNSYYIKRVMCASVTTLTFSTKTENLIGKPYQIVNTEEEDDGDPVVNVCDSQIYCQGPILAAANLFGLYNDSKDYVDQPLKDYPNITLKSFNDTFLDPQTGLYNYTNVTLKSWIDAHFLPPGDELDNCTEILIGWTDKPEKLSSRIADPELREWAFKLHGIWKELCKKISANVANHSELHSLIPVPNEFIIPGGRFREFYYWDTYWVIKGLLASELYKTAENVILNLVSMLHKLGFVPNGGRVYYEKRSQPPFLIPMVYEYYENTGNKTFLQMVLNDLDTEFNFWQTNRSVVVNINGTDHTVYRYNTPSNVPRPESYKEDLATAKNFTSNAARKQLWRNLASTAESGLDFSTRWFKDHLTLSTIETTNIVPVDLNALLCWNMNLMEYLANEAGNTSMSAHYHYLRSNFTNTFDTIFYNQEGAWFDYHLENKAQRYCAANDTSCFYPAIAVPLFASCYRDVDLRKPEKLFLFINNTGAFNYAGGVPASLIQNSNEQWDFPNGWPTLNHMIIEGLRKSENPIAQEQAFQIARKWVLSNYRVFNATGHMWEKYDVIDPLPHPGSGGEYVVQDGFGWTNGVILDLLMHYGDRLFINDCTKDSTSSDVDASNINLILVLFMGTFVVYFKL
uniref:Trehalase n=1 Tax=Acrobeloides nanus TaxID=290746 RepID=A0A914E6P1_9BILA